MYIVCTSGVGRRGETRKRNILLMTVNMRLTPHVIVAVFNNIIIIIITFYAHVYMNIKYLYSINTVILGTYQYIIYL